MNTQIILYIITALLFALTLVLNWKFNLLKDSSAAIIKPYSYARVQMAWWAIIIISCIVAIIFSHRAIPNLDRSTLILISLGTATALAAGLVDVKHDTNPNIVTVTRDEPGQGFWLDILSDANGVSIPRVQAVSFNIIFGCYFWYMTWYNLPLPVTATFTIDNIMPMINDTCLMLMGISSTAYVGFKMTENTPSVEKKQD